MSLTIFNILTHPFSYENYRNGSRPDMFWNLDNGDWIGMDRKEFPALLGAEVLKLTKKYHYEILQPEPKADKIYSHRYQDGLVHRLFPAQTVQKMVGMKLTHPISSPEMINFIKRKSKIENVIINLNGNFSQFNLTILEDLKHLPIILTFRGVIYLPGSKIFKFRKNPLASFTYLLDHFKIKNLIPHIDYITHMNDENIESLNKIYSGPKTKLTSGIDFNFWKKLSKYQCRKELGLPEQQFILFASSRLIPLKQVDKLINTIKELDESHNFLLLISGSGSHSYEKYLKDEAASLMEKDKIRFVGYLFDEELRKYYSASDVFVHTSMSEGSPTSIMKAFGCELPVIHTDIGNTVEVLNKYNSGKIIRRYDYQQWKEVISQTIKEQDITILNRETARKYYEWSAVAKGFLDIYNELTTKYYSLKQKVV